MVGQRKPSSFEQTFAMCQPLFLIPIVLADCGDDEAAKSPPAHAEVIADEGEILKLTLTPQAQQRLGIALTKAGDGSASSTREVAVPPTVADGVPINSATNLLQIGSQQVAADPELARAPAQARLARIALARAESLVREEAGSIRARDEAAAALLVAKAALGAARQQRGLLVPPAASLGSQPVL